MERLCFSFEINPGTGDEYDRMHREIWPELADAIREAGYRNYSLFRNDTSVICACECHPDAATAQRLMAERHQALTERWNEAMAPFIVRDADGNDRRTMYPPCWHLDDEPRA
ncbi:MAG: L-rhamnose mutarotase [Actinobacteria bacterium]|nr:L-rhamnose mutarotase [Actinomycetota bacterium]